VAILERERERGRDKPLVVVVEQLLNSRAASIWEIGDGKNQNVRTVE
jgi:hypothetical protein